MGKELRKKLDSKLNHQVAYIGGKKWTFALSQKKLLIFTTYIIALRHLEPVQNTSVLQTWSSCSALLDRFCKRTSQDLLSLLHCF